MVKRISLGDAQANPPDVIIGERIHVKKGVFLHEEIEARYLVDIFAESQCGKCKNRPLRPNAICEPCPNYEGRFRFFKESRLRGTQASYYSLPINDIGYLRDSLRAHPDYKSLLVHNIIDLKRFAHPLRFVGKLYGANETDKYGNPRADQQSIVDQWLAHKCGGIKAPPRTGKTVIGTHLYCHMGVKTVIFAHQSKLLKQFYDAAMGTMDHANPDKRKPAMTNAPQLEKEAGKGRVIHLLKKASDLKKFGTDPNNWPDVLLITIQKVYRKLARVLQFINPYYSMKIVDEGHQGASSAYSRALFAITCPYSLWLSATPWRKDGLDRKSDFTMGPLVAESRTISIPPIVEVKLIEAIPDVDYKHWAFACRWARGSEERNAELVKEVFKDLAAGHDVVIVPVGSRSVQKVLLDAINDKIKRLKRRPDSGWEEFPYPLAVELNANSDADSVIDRVDDGRPCVLIAQISMIKQGIDMARPSMIYLNEPNSATRDVGAPMFEQLSYRVATPSPSKPMEPTVKIMIDNIGSFRGALRGLFWNEILPGSKPDATPHGPKYKLAENTYAIMSGLGKEKRVGKGKNAKFATVRKAPVGGKW